MRTTNLKNFKTKIITILAVLILATTAGAFTGCGSLNPNQNNNQVATTQQTGNLPYANKDEALKALDQIQIAEPDKSVKYDREQYFGTWQYDKATKTNTRTKAFQQQGQDVKMENNKIVSGKWYIKYIDQTITCNTKSEVSKMDLDHICPLKFCFEHNAATWTQEKREQLANDLEKNLIVSDQKSNRSKSDQSIGTWLPNNKAYHLEYAEKWIDVCSHYGVSITQADYDTIKNILNAN